MNGQEGIHGFQVCRKYIVFFKCQSISQLLKKCYSFSYKVTSGKLGTVRYVENQLVGYGLRLLLQGMVFHHFLDYV